MNERILITICARGGSKGIPGKNIKIINGRPLIAYTIKTALSFAKQHSAVIGLSTDSDEIKLIAGQYGLKTSYSRPAFLASDTAGKISAVADLIKFEEESKNLNFDYIIDLDVTSPLRSIDDLNNALEKLKAVPEAYNIFSVSKAARNPYFNMVEEAENGFVNVVKQSGPFLTRQSAPTVYDMNASFYIYRKAFFNTNQQKATSEKSLAFVVSHVCFDLDEPNDFLIMEMFLQQDLLDFSL